MSKKLLENFYIRSITFLPFISVSKMEAIYG